MSCLSVEWLDFSARWTSHIWQTRLFEQSPCSSWRNRKTNPFSFYIYKDCVAWPLIIMLTVYDGTGRHRNPWPWTDSSSDEHHWSRYTTEGGSEANWNTTEGDGGEDPWPRTVPTQLGPIYAVVEIVCAVLSVGGNSAVLYVYIRQKSLRTVKNAYVVSLAVADLLVGLIGIPAALATSVGLPRNFHGK